MILHVFVIIIIGFFFATKAHENGLSRVIWLILGLATYLLAGFGSLILYYWYLYLTADSMEVTAEVSFAGQALFFVFGLAGTAVVYQQIERRAVKRRQKSMEALKETDQRRRGAVYSSTHLQLNLVDNVISREGSSLQGGGSGVLYLDIRGEPRSFVLNHEVALQGPEVIIRESFTGVDVELALDRKGDTIVASISYSTGPEIHRLDEELRLTLPST